MIRDRQARDAQANITIHNESGESLPITASTISALAALIGEQEKTTFGMIEVVYVDERTIVEINRHYLQHDYVTDIITFPYQDPGADLLEGTLYCCASRIRRQAGELNESVENEFQRIFIHGMLHLTGYDDKTKEEQAAMRKREDFYLKAYSGLV